MFSVRGYYTIKQEDNIIYEGNNLITLLGESFFLNRCINNTLTPIQYITIGNAEIIPLKSDTQLGNEKYRKICTTEADLNKKRIILTASFTPSEINGITEIGVSNGNILISHDTFEEITSDLLINPVGTVEIIYSFQFVTGSIRKNWIKYNMHPNTYRLYEPSEIINVFEKDTGNGYRKMGSLDELKDNEYSYYYDKKSMNLYVHCYTIDEKPYNPLSENINIIIETK